MDKPKRENFILNLNQKVSARYQQDKLKPLITPSIVPESPLLERAGLYELGNCDLDKVNQTQISELLNGESGYSPNESQCPNLYPLDLKSSPLIPTTIKEHMASSNGIFNDSTNRDNLDKQQANQSENSSNKNRQDNDGDYTEVRSGNVSRCDSMSVDCDGSDESERDRQKIERKRERNRLAASKCRRRKVERIEELEKQVKERDEEIKRLKRQIERLKQLKTEH